MGVNPIWQACCDESFGEGFFVLSSCISTPENWEAFNIEWRQLLPTGVLGNDGKYHFKMGEMSRNPERMERTQAFLRVVVRHVRLFVNVVLEIEHLDNVKRRLFFMTSTGETIDLEVMNPYVLAFNTLVSEVCSDVANDRFEGIIPPDASIEFIFDDRSEKRKILAAWDVLAALYPSVSTTAAKPPRFVNDDAFPPVQAADLVAWWLREACVDVKVGRRQNIGQWIMPERLPIVSYMVHEEAIVRGVTENATKLGLRVLER